jgi:competence protein ComFC
MDNILNLIFPPKCVFCENYGSLFCESCLKTCRHLCRNYTLTSLRAIKPLQVFCYFAYEDKIRECIKYSKYSKKQFAVLREVSKYAVSELLRRKIEFPQSYVIPIPLSNQKKRDRGFNQAEIIASVFAKGYGLPMQNSILTRQKETTSQHRLNKEERLENMKDAFAVPDCVKGHSFILVDDICTTGATLIESANAFYKAGAKGVTAFTLSRRL